MRPVVLDPATGVTRTPPPLWASQGAVAADAAAQALEKVREGGAARSDAPRYLRAKTQGGAGEPAVTMAQKCVPYNGGVLPGLSLRPAPAARV